jgi:hypothetical protein
MPIFPTPLSRVLPPPSPQHVCKSSNLLNQTAAQMESEEKKSLQNRTNMSDRFAYAFRAQTQKKIPLQKKDIC